MKFFSLFILVACTQVQANNFFGNLLSQTVVQPLIEEQKQYFITPAIGTGTYTSSVSIQGVDLLRHTNSNFYIFGLDINGYSSHVFIPYRDKSDRLSRAVDSDLFRIQTGFKISPEIVVEAIYSKVIGFYQGNIDDLNAPVTKFPNLGLRKYSFIGTYMLDSTHRCSLFSPISYSKVTTGKSGFFGVELNRHEITGIGDLNSKLPLVDQKTDSIQSAKAISLLGSMGWSQSKMYQNFFWSYAIGIGLGGTYVEKFYAGRNSTDTLLPTTVPFSGQFGWNKNDFTAGLFAAFRSWGVTLDQFSLSNSNGNSGFYLAYQF